MGIVQEWRPGEALWVPLGLGGAGLALRTPPKPKEGTGGHRVRGGGDPVLPGWPCRGLAWGRRKGSVWERGRSEEGEGTLRAPPAPFPAHPRACRAPEHWRLCQVHPKNQPRVGSQPPASPGACPSPAAGRGARRRAWNGTEEPLGGAGAQVPSPGGLHPPWEHPGAPPVLLCRSQPSGVKSLLQTGLRGGVLGPALPAPALAGSEGWEPWESRQPLLCCCQPREGHEHRAGAQKGPRVTWAGWASLPCHLFLLLPSLPCPVVPSFSSSFPSSCCHPCTGQQHPGMPQLPPAAPLSWHRAQPTPAQPGPLGP